MTGWRKRNTICSTPGMRRKTETGSGPVLPASRRPKRPDAVLDAARRLDRHYIPARYPNSFDRGIPREYYTAEDARQAIADAETVCLFVRNSIREPGEGN